MPAIAKRKGNEELRTRGDVFMRARERGEDLDRSTTDGEPAAFQRRVKVLDPRTTSRRVDDGEGGGGGRRRRKKEAKFKKGNSAAERHDKECREMLLQSSWAIALVTTTITYFIFPRPGVNCKQHPELLIRDICKIFIY